MILDVLSAREQPSAWCLLEIIEQRLGWKARWEIKPVFEALLALLSTLKGAQRDYLESLRQSPDLDSALRGASAPKEEVASSIDILLRQSEAYRDSFGTSHKGVYQDHQDRSTSLQQERSRNGSRLSAVTSTKYLHMGSNDCSEDHPSD